jgi:hypothetical protein
MQSHLKFSFEMFWRSCHVSFYRERLTLRLTLLTHRVKANVQLKSSIRIGVKVEFSPQGFALGVKAEIEKKSFQSALKLLINAELYGLVLAPSNLGSQSVTLGANVFAFISNLGPKNTPKMLKVGPNFFWPWLLV